jgi:hypothetical protein
MLQGVVEIFFLSGEALPLQLSVPQARTFVYAWCGGLLSCHRH